MKRLHVMRRLSLHSGIVAAQWARAAYGASPRHAVLACFGFKIGMAGRKIIAVADERRCGTGRKAGSFLAGIAWTGRRRRKFQKLGQQDGASVRHEEAGSRMHQEQDRRDERVPASERPAGEWPCRLAEGEKRPATRVRRNSPGHARGPAIHGIGLAVTKFRRCSHVGPESGLGRAEENDGPLPDAVIGFSVEQSEHVQPLRMGRFRQFLDHHGLPRGVVDPQLASPHWRRRGWPGVVILPNWTASPPCGPASRTSAACPRWSSGSPRRCGHAWGS